MGNIKKKIRLRAWEGGGVESTPLQFTENLEYFICNNATIKLFGRTKLRIPLYFSIFRHLIINSIHYMYFKRVDYDSRVRNDFICANVPQINGLQFSKVAGLFLPNLCRFSVDFRSFFLCL